MQPVSESRAGFRIKGRLVADLVRGLPVGKASTCLRVQKKSGADQESAFESAIANAEQRRRRYRRVEGARNRFTSKGGRHAPPRAPRAAVQAAQSKPVTST